MKREKKENIFLLIFMAFNESKDGANHLKIEYFHDIFNLMEFNIKFF